MRLTREQKLEMVLKHLDDGISFAQLACEYHLGTDKVKYFVTLYRMHGEQIFLNQEELAVYTRETKLQAIHRYLNGDESYRKIALELGLTDANILRDWVSLFKEKGEDAIQDSHRRRNYMLREERMSQIADAEISDRIKYLEAENDYLKKLYSLIQTRGRTSKKKSK